MCTGLELLPLALTAAGSAVSGYGAYTQGQEEQANNQRIADARNAELEPVLGKVYGNAAQGRAVFNRRLGEVSPSNSRADQRRLTKQRVRGTTRVAAGGKDADIPISGSAPGTVKTEIGKKMLEATKRAKQAAKAKGKLHGYGDFVLDQTLRDQQAGRDIGMFNNFVQGDVGVLPFSQDFAGYSAYQPSSGVGEIFQSAGNLLASGAGAYSPELTGASSGYSSPYDAPLDWKTTVRRG